MYCGAADVTRLVPYLPSKWELHWSSTLCCIFHLRDFCCCNNHTISAFCQEPGQAELIMFVLARFLAHWTTAIVLNSVPPLMEHTHFLALTQEIKFFGTGPLCEPISLERIKRNRDWMEKKDVMLCVKKKKRERERDRLCHRQQGENILAQLWHWNCTVQLSSGCLAVVAATFSSWS